ncbi:MAG: LamG-like jellyroll fold domain-containing protein [Cyclobacteriaceae bacterium]
MFPSPFFHPRFVLSLLFIFSSFVGFSQIYVDDDALDDTGAGTMADPKQFIQSGIDLATPGQTVFVFGGTYNESVTIDKSLTLQGPNVGVAGNGTRGLEAIIEPASQGNAIQITADNVTIDGLQVGVGNVDAAIYQTDQTDIIIQNNVINADSVGVAMVGTGVLTGSINVNNNFVTIADFLTSNTSSLATGVALVGLSGTIDIDLSDNVYSGGAQAVFVFGCLSTNVLNISDESVTNAIRGISVFSFNGVVRASSTLQVNGMSVTNFDEPVSEIAGFPQAGIYFYTDGSSTDSHIITATVSNSTFSGTSNSASDYAGIICGDFSSTDYVAVLQDITINESTFSNNENRGIQIRGQNTSVDINRSTFQNNGFDPVGAGGNPGFHVVVRNGAIATIANSLFINPASQTSDEFDGLSLQAGSSLSITNSFFNQNGNGTIAGTSGIDLSFNHFSTTDESTIVVLVGTGNDFTPWIASGTDTAPGTEGFQPDLSTLYVSSQGQQTLGDRIDEAYDLVTSGGTLNINSGTYTETLAITKPLTLNGANQGTPGNGSRVAETIIEALSSFEIGIAVVADNVTIDGLQIGTSNSSSNISNGIAVDGNQSITIQNNVVYPNSAGIIVENISDGTINVNSNEITMIDLEDQVTATLPSTGIQLLSISGGAQVSLSNNDISNASYGIAGYAFTPTTTVTIDGGNFSECTQGISVNNTNGSGGYSPSNVNIQNVTMTSFQGPDGDVLAPDAQAGIYLGVFSSLNTGNATDNDTLVATIESVDISGVGFSMSSNDYSAIYVADFNGDPMVGVPDDISIDVSIKNSNIHDNENRGVYTRGANANTVIRRSTFDNNGFNPTSTGSSLSTFASGSITITNSYLINPSTGTATVETLLAQQEGSITASDNSFNVNDPLDEDNRNLAEEQSNGIINMSNNWFGTSDLNTIEGYFTDETTIDFSPWIASGIDTNPSFAGFQPDLSTLHVGTSGDQNAGGIIQEGHDLVDTLGTVVVNGNSYNTDTLEVQKSFTLSPLVGLTIQELTTNGGTLTVDNDLTVTSTVTLTNGVVDLDQDDGTKSDDPVLTITGATISGTFSDANHIEGKVSADVTMSTSFLFPVGDEGGYRPVTLLPTVASTFEVAHYAENAPSGDGFGTITDLADLVGEVSTALSPSVIQSVLDTRYWSIDRSAGSGNTDVTLQVLNSDMDIEPGVLSITRLDGSDWAEITRVGESGSAPFTVTGTTADFSAFSVASAFSMSPGNVAGGLQMWLKADNGVTGTSSVTQWDDMSGLNRDVTPISANSPALLNDAVNFNEAIDFSDDPMTTGSSGILGANSVYSKFSVFQFDAAAGNNLISSNTNGSALSGNGTDTDIRISHDGTSVLEATSVVAADNYYMVSSIYGAPGSGNNFIRVNGNQVATNITNSTYSDVEIQIGGLAGADGLDGKIAEAIVYNSEIGGGDLGQVESYLAVKYGITLPGTYLASDGGTIWNNAGYSNDVAGIGRDDFSGLDQRKSRTINADSLVTIALGDYDSPTAFVDNDAWLLWGNDNGAITFTEPINNAHSGSSNRIERVWRVQETGTVGTVELAFNSSASTETISLVVHPTLVTFPNDANRQVYEMAYSSATNDYRVTVDLTNGDYFTFAEGPVGGIPAVVITEVITDPKQNWSEDGFHNPAPGSSGTINSDDDWVELFITQSNIDLSGYTIDLIDSDTVSGGLGADEAFTVSNYNSISGGLFQATDSGDFVILGQLVSGAMNQDIQVILRDGNGNVVDQVLIENVSRGTGFNGNSTGVEDESVTRLFNDSDTNDDATDFVLTKASLGTTDLQTGIVLINEVVTDPQRDWDSFSFTGNPAEDGVTSGANDEWIELYIGTDSLNLTNWIIEMIDGSNVSGELTLVSSGGVFNFVSYVSDNSGTFTNTRDGDYLVLGDPTGDMINDVYLVLRDPLGNIVDEVELGTDRASDGAGNEAPNGNATNNSLIDEAVARYSNSTNTGDPSSDFIQTYATPGATNSKSGVVVINEVVTNPQQDWSANGFDGTIGGNGTPSDTDDWIELYFSEDNLNLTNWTIEVTDAGFFSGSLLAGGAFQSSVYFGSGSFLDTRSGDYLVLGNPTGSENITADALIRILDASGTEIDKVEIGDDIEGDGNGDGAPDGDAAGSLSTGLDDESISRIPNATDTGDDVADFSHSTATLGRANSQAPIETIGNALDFDGDNDFVALPQSGNFPISNSSTFTLEMWVNGVAQEDSVVFAEGNSTDDDTRFSLGSGIGADTDKLRFNIVEDDGTEVLDATTNATVFDGNWHHIALVRGSASTADVYVDGILDATNFDYSIGTLTPDTTTIGALVNTTNTSEYLGQIDEMRLWSTARTQVEILENINTTVDQSDAHLLSYYRFDHSSGSDLIDLAGTDDGELENMANDDWITADWAVYAENSTIVQSASGNQSTSGSGQLSIVNATFLVDNDDILLVGHESSDFDTVTTLLPPNTLVTSRYARSWHLTKNDAAGTDGGSVTMSFEIGQEPDSSLTYYLLETPDPSSAFDITPVVGYQPGATSVDFTVDVDSLTDEQYYTLGWSDAGPGNALDFDGTDDFVFTANDASLTLTDFSLEAWVKTSQTATPFARIITKPESGTQNYSLNINDGKPQVRFDNGAGQSAEGTQDVNDGEWHHLAGVFDDTNNLLSLYLDGALAAETSTSAASPLSASEGLFLGKFGDSFDQFFVGEIDEVRIWNDVRTQNEIVEYMNANLVGNEVNLVAYYRFNQGIGNDPYNLPDLSGSGNNGQLQDFDNLDNSTSSSNYVTADRSSLTATVTIINTTVDVLTNSSEELTLTSTTSDFLQDEGDFITWGHDDNDFVEVTSDLPTSSNLAARMDRTWQLTKGDVSDNDGLVTFAFDLGTAPDPDYTYYLLQRTGIAGFFNITEVIGSYPDGDSVKFTVDAAQIASRNYFTLGRSNAGPGHSLDFDETDDQVSMGDNLIDGANTLTVEVWIYPIAFSGTTATTDIRTIISKGDSEAQTGVLGIYFEGDGSSSSNLVVALDNGTTLVESVYEVVTTAINLNTWQHLTITWSSGAGISTYLNGELLGTSSVLSGPLDDVSDAFIIGGSTDTDEDGYEGIIDEVRIWDDVRSEAEIQANLYRSLDVANETNLVAYYKFDDGIAASDNSSPAVDLLADYSGNDLSGDLTGFTLAGGNSNWVLSEIPLADESVASALSGPGNALDFDGSNDYVEVTDNDLLDITEILTLEAWVNVTTSPATASEGVISKFLTAGGQQSFSLDINTGDSVVFTLSANGANSASVSSDNSIPLGEWVHLAAVYNPSTSMEIYVNGILDGERTSGVPAAIHSGSAPLWIGAITAGVIDADNAIEASIDEVRIWNTARTRVELQDNMFKQLEGNESGLVAYYTFDEISGTSTLNDATANGLNGSLPDPSQHTSWVSASAREPEKNIEVNNWNTTATWKSRAVPNATTEQLDLSQDITVDVPVAVDLLNINSGVTVTVSAGQTLTVNGNFINNGSIIGDGTLVINGGSPALYGGTISNLQLAGANATLMSATTVSNTLDLNSNSTLNIDDYNLTVNEISGFSSSAYIETKNQNTTSGFVIKSLAVADGDFTFPIGSSGSCTPLTVKNLGSTGNIEARVFDNTYAQGTSGVVIDTEKEVNKSWEINGDAGVNVTVTLQWNGTDEDPNFASARSTAYMSKNDYNWWEKITPDVGVTGSDPYMIAASGIQTFSVFGTGTEDSSLPVTWMAFEAFENENQDVELHWSTASELNNDRFEVEKSFDGNTFKVIGEITGNGTVNTLSDYQFMDTEPFNGINYYRLRQVDYDGTDDYSELVSVFVDVQREYNITLSPNPTFDVTTLNIEWENDEDYAVGIFDMMGRNLGVVHSKFTQLNLDLTTLPKGMYIIKIHTGDKVIAKKLIKY